MPEPLRLLIAVALSGAYCVAMAWAVLGTDRAEARRRDRRWDRR